ncbi:hypothetical protein [Metapseudomonas otitidis]|uniref:hypothetical protein n=1 Tax=Metapseudomonas otitidis TaxID=319939 RepID=UPI0013F62807|nr:hypothetical protein [Pseudomonas otitidis]
MKVDPPKLSPTLTPPPRERQQTAVAQPAVAPAAVSPERPSIRGKAQRSPSQPPAFNLQLNQQLSQMQATEHYLGELVGHLEQLKLNLGRELASSLPSDRETLRETIRDVNALLRRRGARTGQSLDADLRLRLGEPVRSRFRLEGLDSLEAIQAAGRETLVFSFSRQPGEALAVVLDEGLAPEQVLRRFNQGLGPAGLRAELDSEGNLRFSASETQWQVLQDQLQVQGEGGLFPRARRSLAGHEEGWQSLAEPDGQGHRELRSLLDTVLGILERIERLRDQLAKRQDGIRQFLAHAETRNERQWAQSFARSLFDLMSRGSDSYGAVAQAVVAQAQLSRFTVVSLLA